MKSHQNKGLNMHIHPSLIQKIRRAWSGGAPFTHHAIGRGAGGGRHGHGAGRGAGGFGDGDMPGSGRKFRGEDLQLLLLVLLAEAPRHGYELIKALDQQSNGAYIPSPGMVYPTLTLLEELGHAVAAVDGARKCYSVSDAGRAHLEANRERVDIVSARLKLVAKKMDMMRRALAGESPDEAGAPWIAEFVEARRALKHSLLMRHDVAADEQRRIAQILRRAVAEIEAAPGAQS